MDGFSTYLFAIYDPYRFVTYAADFPPGPDTHIGSDVIVEAGAVVAGHVPDYAIVAGDPARAFCVCALMLK